MIKEKAYQPVSGWFPLVVTLALILGGIILFWATLVSFEKGTIPFVFGLLAALACAAGGGLSAMGFQAIAPNDSRVFLLFGNYVGSSRESGFFWVNPFYSKRRLSLRIRNFETGSITTPEQKDAAGKVVQTKSRT